MNKHLLLSILFGLSLSVAIPVHAESMFQQAWNKVISQFKAAPAQNQPAQRDNIEAPLQIPVPSPVQAPAQQTNWFSRTYAQFSGWLNNKFKMQNKTEAAQAMRSAADSLKELALQSLKGKNIKIQDLQDLKEAHNRALKIITNARNEAHQLINAHEETYKRDKAQDAEIKLLSHELNSLQEQIRNHNNSRAQIESLQKREQELQAQLQELRGDTAVFASHVQNERNLAIKAEQDARDAQALTKETQAQLEVEKSVTMQLATQIQTLRRENARTETERMAHAEAKTKLYDQQVRIAALQKQLEYAKAPKPSILIEIVKDKKKSEDQKIDEIAMYLAAGAKIDEKHHRDLTKQTPLMTAADEGYSKIVRFLLEQKASLEVEDSSGRTALFYAAEKGHREVVRLLLDHNANIHHIAAGKRTILHDMYHRIGVNENDKKLASSPKQYLEKILFITQDLFEKGIGRDIESRDNNMEMTPILCAASFKAIELVEYLASKGANLNAKTKHISDKLPAKSVDQLLGSKKEVSEDTQRKIDAFRRNHYNTVVVRGSWGTESWQMTDANSTTTPLLEHKRH